MKSGIPLILQLLVSRKSYQTVKWPAWAHNWSAHLEKINWWMCVMVQLPYPAITGWNLSWVQTLTRAKVAQYISTSFLIDFISHEDFSLITSNSSSISFFEGFFLITSSSSSNLFFEYSFWSPWAHHHLFLQWNYTSYFFYPQNFLHDYKYKTN